ncbi:SdiA-regulated domain-containing protein [Stutzerimonas urumqiensis]|uniref:SdiA-regulated domain-containing protein n=1 Tax=Stutzerimonas urumqiensis TaxID=638269 RepID=UPI003DA3C273
MPVLANARPGVRLLRRPWVIAGLLAALGVASTLHLHLDERLLHALRQAVGAVASADRGVALADYRAELDAHPVASVSGNLSGLAWDADRDQLWAVVNNPETLLALSPEGETLARYPLDGFTDVEAVAYLGDDRLLLVEERSQKLVVVPVPTAEAPLRAEAAVFSLALGMAGNAGLEGADYDAAGDRLFVVKEHSPRQLLEVAGLRRSLTTGATAITLTDRSAWLDDHDMARDLSSVHHDAASGHLLLLSDESRLMMELDGEGRLVSYRSLWGGFAGLADRVPQAEGLTLDDQGRLYLVSEPNLFYRFVRED